MESRVPSFFDSNRFKIVVTVGASLALAYVISRILRRKPFEDIPAENLHRIRRCKPSTGDHQPTSKSNANGHLPNHKPESSSVVSRAKPPIVSLNRRMRNSSFSSTASTVVAAGEPNHVTFKEALVEETPILLARDSFIDAIKQWERALSKNDSADTALRNGDVSNVVDDRNEKLEKLLDKAYQLRDEMNEFLNSLSPDILENYAKANRYLTYNDVNKKNARRTLSVLSDDSFASALEDLMPPILDLDVEINRPIESDVEELILYQEALGEVDALNVACRVLRTSFLKCKSDDDFLAKLYCIRLAFDKLLEDYTKRDWLNNIGRKIITSLLKKANKDANGFQEAYDKMMTFAQNNANWTKIEDELRGRQLVEFSFYDIVLDFIFMDAFEDLADPPASVVAVAQNRFLSSRMIESTLYAVVWSVLKAKRARLKYADGFIARFYDISEHVSPIMAFGFLGSNQELKDLCNYFKSQICNFLIDLFNGERVRFTCVEDLTHDIWQICKARAQITCDFLGN